MECDRRGLGGRKQRVGSESRRGWGFGWGNTGRTRLAAVGQAEVMEDLLSRGRNPQTVMMAAGRGG